MEKNNVHAPINYKALSAKDVKIDQGSRTISGYLAVFGNKDNDDDIIIKGAFAKSLAERGVGSPSNRKIVLLYQHDVKLPLAPFSVLKEDDYGLYFESILDQIPLGDNCLTQLKSGTLNQFSIGFQYIWDKMKYDEEKEAYLIYELNLFEGSIVTFGANEMTYFDGMKSELIESEEKNLKKETNDALKSLDYPAQLHIRQLICKHISLSEVKSQKEALKQMKAEKGEKKSILKKIKINHD